MGFSDQVSGAGTGAWGTPLATAGNGALVGGGAGTGAVGAAGSGTSAAGIGDGAAGAAGFTGGGSGVGGVGDVAGSDGAAGAAGTGSTQTDSSLAFDVLTQPLGGQYAPANIGAIWVETPSGTFVKTLATWYWIRVAHLNKFVAETNYNTVDAVTGPSLAFHTMHHATWNFKDVNEQVVPDGAYQLIIETNDSNGSSKFDSIPFTKGAPSSTTPASTPYYTSMQLTIQ